MLEYPFQSPKTPEESVEILAGVHWVQMPLPFQLNHVNCWYLSGGAGENKANNWLIDTGIASSKTSNVWAAHFKRFAPPNHLLMTHFHPDHSGLAGWFSKHGSTVHASSIEMDIARAIYALDDATVGEAYAHWYSLHGIENHEIDTVKTLGNTFTQCLVEPPEHYCALEHGQIISIADREFEVICVRGHAADMIMLYSADSSLLIAADQILPHITPNVSLSLETPGVKHSDPNPLASFLEDIQKLTRLPENTLVLPSHGKPFFGLHERIMQLTMHHEQRCTEIVAACKQPHTAADLFALLFNRKLDAQQLSFALGEVLAHTRYLESRGELASKLHKHVQYFSALTQ